MKHHYNTLSRHKYYQYYVSKIFCFQNEWQVSNIMFYAIIENTNYKLMSYTLITNITHDLNNGGL